MPIRAAAKALKVEISHHGVYFKIVAVLGMHFCDPNQLIATKQRNKLAAANKALCYLTRGSFKEDQHTQASRLHRHTFD